MQKYYIIEGFEYSYGTIHYSIQEYYIVKEGWIPCVDYRENPKDEYYAYTGDREAFCVHYDGIDMKAVFESKEAATEELLRRLDEFYKEEMFELSTEYLRIKTLLNK